MSTALEIRALESNDVQLVAGGGVSQPCMACRSLLTAKNSCWTRICVHEHADGFPRSCMTERAFSFIKTTLSAPLGRRLQARTIF